MNKVNRPLADSQPPNTQLLLSDYAQTVMISREFQTIENACENDNVCIYIASVLSCLSLFSDKDHLLSLIDQVLLYTEEKVSPHFNLNLVLQPKAFFVNGIPEKPKQTLFTLSRCM